MKSAGRRTEPFASVRLRYRVQPIGKQISTAVNAIAGAANNHFRCWFAHRERRSVIGTASFQVDVICGSRVAWVAPAGARVAGSPSVPSGYAGGIAGQRSAVRLQERLELLVRLVGGLVGVLTGDRSHDRGADDLPGLGDPDHQRPVLAHAVLTVGGDRRSQVLREARGALRVLPHRGAGTGHPLGLDLQGHLRAGGSLDVLPGVVLDLLGSVYA